MVQVGVEIDRVERMYDSFLDAQIMEQAQKCGFYDTKSDILGRIETVFNDTTGTGLNDLLGKFWGAWDDVSSNPAGQVERENLVAVSDKLAEMIRTYGSDLQNIVADIEKSVAGNVLQINQYASELADLNAKIIAAGKDTGDANTLRDSQMSLLQDLSGLVDIAYINNDNGTISAFLSNGSPLVLEGMHRDLRVLDQGVTSPSVIVLEGNAGQNLNGAIEGGKVGALIQMRDEVIPSYRERLNSLASAIIDEVNAQHNAGYDAYGNAGGDFFADPGSDTSSIAQNMRLSSAVAADANRIAASATVAGDGENARATGAIQNRFIMNNGTATIGDAYSAFIGKIGLDVAGVERDVDHNTQIMDGLSNRRASTSGVSIDEEMLALIKFQTGYNAAGQLCRSVQDMLDVLMSIVE
jgi:flagellar hook-associated protein 1 FlgK